MVKLFSYLKFLIKISKNVTNLIKFNQTPCIFDENELKYVIEKTWLSQEDCFLKCQKKFLYKNGGFLQCQ